MKGVYPAVGLLLQRGSADDEDMEVCADIFRRFALNFKSRLAFARTTDCTPEEVPLYTDAMPAPVKEFRNWPAGWAAHMRKRSRRAMPRMCGEAAAKTLAGPLRLPKCVVALLRILERLGVANKPWEDMLRKNGAFDRRFDRPYV